MGASEPILVVFVNSMWGEYPAVDASACAVPCAFSTDIADARRADVAVFHLPTSPPLDSIEKPPGQMWVAYSLESDVTVPLMRDERAMARFDFEVSYRRTADVWCPYAEHNSLTDFLAAPVPKTEPYPVARFQSNLYDLSGRNLWAAELTRRIKVASYGTVLPTMRSAGTIATREARLAVAARHKFTLAFENSISPDYVTDKLYDALIAGSVPVYLGAPNVADFAPARHSYIDVADFDGPDELARYLNHLDTHAEEYEAYLEWKRSGPDERFVELVASASEEKFCRLAELADARRRSPGSGRGA